MTMMDKTSRGHKHGEEGTEALFNDFLDRVAEASYLVASECGFRGSYLAFLSVFKKTLDQVVRDRERR